MTLEHNHPSSQEQLIIAASLLRLYPKNIPQEDMQTD